MKMERVETSFDCDARNTLRHHDSELEIEYDICCLGDDRSSLFSSSLQNLRTIGHQEAQSKGTAPSSFRIYETCVRTNQEQSEINTINAPKLCTCNIF